MRTKQVLIIDDERLARKELNLLLKDFQELSVVGEAANADEGITLIEQLKPDLIFLDIKMPGKSGFDMLEELHLEPSVIFTTAYDQYAIKAFEFNALDYLLKPIQKERLGQALERVMQAEELLPEPETPEPYLDHLFLKDGDKCFFVDLETISLFASYGNYVRVFFQEKPVLIHRSLNQLELRLPTRDFFRANRYSIINIRHIQSIRVGIRNKLIVSLRSGHEVELSERKSIEFRNRWSV